MDKATERGDQRLKPRDSAPGLACPLTPAQLHFSATKILAALAFYGNYNSHLKGESYDGNSIM